MELRVEPRRLGKMGDTGIYVRAMHEGKVTVVDIADLDKESLLKWLRSRGGDNPWAEDTVGILMGHGHLHDHGQIAKEIEDGP